MSKRTMGANKPITVKENLPEHASLAAAADQWVMDEADGLKWRQSLKVGDEIAIEFHEPLGVCYQIFNVTKIENGMIFNSGWDEFSIETGTSPGDPQMSGWSRVVPPTPEMHTRIDLEWDVVHRAAKAATYNNFSYLPIEDLRTLQAILLKLESEAVNG